MSVKDLPLPELVETREALQRLVEDLGRQPRIAVDSESNSLHAYRERVCLLQFSTADRDYVVDPLALEDLGSLGPIFSDVGIEKVFHASEYDIICLRRDYGYSFANIFDTMQAGRILGRRQAGLDRLLDERFGVKVNKRFQKADWGVRPLSRDLLLYAAQDTHYLLPLRGMLDAQLREQQLRELAQEDFDMACSNDAPPRKAESPPWERFAARHELDRRDLTVLNELLACREAIAARLDRPPFKVVDEDRLMDIAKARPASLHDLEGLGLGSKQLDLWGKDLLAAVARGIRNPLVKKTASRMPSNTYLRRLDKLKEWRKKAAAAMGVESDVVLPRALLLALADGGAGAVASVMRPSPWRLHHFGDQITKVLQGVGS